jgi:hypothetical protein
LHCATGPDQEVVLGVDVGMEDLLLLEADVDDWRWSSRMCRYRYLVVPMTPTKTDATLPE